MKAITIWQPWASLILHGFKRYEFRGWKPNDALIGQRIAIHAGARRIPNREFQVIRHQLARGGGPRMGLEDGAGEWMEEYAGVRCSSLPHGAVIATAVLESAVLADKIVGEFGVPVENDSDRGDHFNYAWKLTDVRPVMPPDFCRGKQGWWMWYPDQNALGAQLPPARPEIADAGGRP